MLVPIFINLKNREIPLLIDTLISILDKYIPFCNKISNLLKSRSEYILENIWFFSRQIFYLMEKYECILKILYCYRYFIFCRLFTYVFIILHIIFVSTLFLQLYNKILISTKNEDTWFFRSSLQLFIAKFPFSFSWDSLVTRLFSS